MLAFIQEDQAATADDDDTVHVQCCADRDVAVCGEDITDYDPVVGLTTCPPCAKIEDSYHCPIIKGICYIYYEESSFGIDGDCD